MTLFRVCGLVLLLGVVGACGGGGGNGTAECDDTCDSNATCQDTGNDTGTCECNAGFTGDGLTCEADVSDPCLGVSNCTAVGTSCDGDILVDCAADTNGCLLDQGMNCADSGTICDDSGAEAACVLDCSDEPGCVGLSDGEGFCDGATPVTCSLGTDGCLDAVDGTSCGLEVCDDSGAAPICVANASGDSCVAAFLIQDDVILSGTDITADYTDVESFGGTDCSPTSATGTPVEAVFTADLVAGETITLSEHGGIDVVMGILPACDGGTACYDSRDFSETTGVQYTATADETVFLYVSSFSGSPVTVDYEIRVAFSICGNAVVEGSEACDDNATADDGCTLCEVDFGFDCDNSGNPSVCTGPTDLGTFAAAQAIPDTVETISLLDDESFFYTITFSEDVLLSGTLDATGGEDIDFAVIDSQGAEVFSDSTSAGEAWVNELLIAGTYTLELFAFSAIPNGWTLTLSTEAAPVCGNALVEFGESCDDNATADDGCTLCAVDPGFNCDNSAGASVCTPAPDLGTFAAAEAIPATVETISLLDDESFSYTITFSEDVLLSGTLDATGGEDIDFAVIDSQGAVVFTDSTPAGEAWANELVFAGTYTLEVFAFNPIPDGWTLTLSTVAMPAPTDLGTFAAADPIVDVTGGPVPGGNSDLYSITFSTNVVLDGSLSGDVGDLDVFFFDSTGTEVFSSESFGDETFVETLPAGTYTIRVFAFGSTQVNTYTLSMSTTAP